MPATADPGHGHVHAGGPDHGHGADHGDAPPVLDRDYWEAHYAARRGPWRDEPNPHLVSEVSGLPAGCALDVGCGEGGNAIWLARQGWRVTGVDLSAAAVERARRHAADAGADVAARTTWLEADLARFDPGAARFDLVSALFVHLPDALRDDVLRRLARAVAPGGSLLVVTHDPSDLATTVSRPATAAFVATADQAADLLPADEWELLAAGSRNRTEADAEGRPVTVRDGVARARRKVAPAPGD